MSFITAATSWRAPLGLALCVATAAGCGGGGGTGAGTDARPDAVQAPIRGSVVGSPEVTGTLTTAQINQFADSLQVRQLTGSAKCNVTYRSVEYNTKGGAGEDANATTALLVPSGSDPACQGERPVLVYAHGTVTDRNFDMADIQEGEGLGVTTFFASRGYIVVAPNYVGYDRSRSPYHPYLNAEAQAMDVVDALRAAKSVLPVTGTKASDKLFLSGYSQGGFVAMATHRAIERDYGSEFKVAASMPMSGPYAMREFAASILEGDVNLHATTFIPMLVTSYQKSYGNLYRNPADMFQPPYASKVETLFPTTLDQEAISASLPVNLFDRGDGSSYLVRTDVRDTLRQDFRLSRSSPFRDAIVRNDLLDWRPQAPMALCGASRDRMVFFSNTTAAAAYFASRGAAVAAHDLRNRASLPAGATGDMIHEAFSQAAAAYPGIDDHALAVAGCHALAAGLFESI